MCGAWPGYGCADPAGCAEADRAELAAETDKQDQYLDVIGEALGNLTRAAKVCVAQPIPLPDWRCRAVLGCAAAEPLRDGVTGGTGRQAVAYSWQGQRW